MSKIADERPSIKKFQEDIKSMKLISFFDGKMNRQKFKEIEK
ncbi:MAG: hypothetical protein ACLKAK_10010 [Alkaliphilus sp.]